MKITNQSQPISHHPFDPFIPEGAEKLIIGTIPPQKFCVEPKMLGGDDVDFYYGSKRNHFWKIMDEITGADLPFKNTPQAVEARKSLLRKLGTGITDMVASCIHRDASALDQALDEIQYKDLVGLLEQHPQITTLIYTSEFVKSLVYKCYKKDHTKHPDAPDNDKRRRVHLNGRWYDVWILYSPSPRGLAGLGEGGRQDRLKQYQKVFGKNESTREMGEGVRRV